MSKSEKPLNLEGNPNRVGAGTEEATSPCLLPRLQASGVVTFPKGQQRSSLTEGLGATASSETQSRPC